MKRKSKLARQELLDFFESKDFNVHRFKQDGIRCAEIETWTDGGVNMIITLMPFTAKSFFSYVKYYDVDELIDGHRQDSRYKNAFTINHSVKDFEKFHKRLKGMKRELKLLIKTNRNND